MKINNNASVRSVSFSGRLSSRTPEDRSERVAECATEVLSAAATQRVENTPAKTRLERIRAHLDAWTSSEGNVEEAKARILECAKTHSPSLDLSDLGLTTLPDLTELHQHLRCFYCSRNRLTSLNLRFLRKLEVLDCSHNQLTSLNVTHAAVFLNHLNFSHNQIKSIVGLAVLFKLEVLMGSNNQLSSVPPFSWLKKLKLCDLSDNKLTASPRFYGQVSQGNQLDGAFRTSKGCVVLLHRNPIH